MRSLYLMDHKKRDAPVAFEGVADTSDVNYVLEDGQQVRSVKVIKTTFHSSLETIEERAKHEGREIVDLLIDGDPEIDFDYMGKISNKTKTIYLDDKGHISYNLRFREKVIAPDGTLQEERDYNREPANMNKDLPLVWTGKFIPLTKAIKMVAFMKVYQIRHTNGLTYDFLFEAAKLLEEKKAMMLMGAGPNGKEPLRLTRGSLTYRAFLMGKTEGDRYRLTLHLSNLELKDLT